MSTPALAGGSAAHPVSWSTSMCVVIASGALRCPGPEDGFQASASVKGLGRGWARTQIEVPGQFGRRCILIACSFAPASNAYFSQVLRAISIPEPDTKIRMAIDPALGDGPVQRDLASEP